MHQPPKRVETRELARKDSKDCRGDDRGKARRDETAEKVLKDDFMIIYSAVMSYGGGR